MRFKRYLAVLVCAAFLTSFGGEAAAITRYNTTSLRIFHRHADGIIQGDVDAPWRCAWERRVQFLRGGVLIAAVTTSTGGSFYMRDRRIPHNVQVTVKVLQKRFGTYALCLAKIKTFTFRG